MMRGPLAFRVGGKEGIRTVAREAGAGEVASSPDPSVRVDDHLMRDADSDRAGRSRTAVVATVEGDGLVIVVLEAVFVAVDVGDAHDLVAVGADSQLVAITAVSESDDEDVSRAGEVDVEDDVVIPVTTLALAELVALVGIVQVTTVVKAAQELFHPTTQVRLVVPVGVAVRLHLEHVDGVVSGDGPRATATAASTAAAASAAVGAVGAVVAVGAVIAIVTLLALAVEKVHVAVLVGVLFGIQHVVAVLVPAADAVGPVVTRTAGDGRQGQKGENKYRDLIEVFPHGSNLSFFAHRWASDTRECVPEPHLILGFKGHLQ